LYDAHQEGNPVGTVYQRETTACESHNLVEQYVGCQALAHDYPMGGTDDPVTAIKNAIADAKHEVHKYHHGLACGLFVAGVVLTVADAPLAVMEAGQIIRMTATGAERAKELQKVGRLGTAGGVSMVGGLTFGCF
jgi:hypothetical protein